MMFKRTRWPLYASVTILLASSGSARALDGNSPLQLNPLNGWRALEIMTQGNNITAVSDPGYGNTASRGTYDGTGAYVVDDTLSIFLNHETGDAAISRIDVGIAEFQQAVATVLDDGTPPFSAPFVTGVGYAYDSIFAGNYHAVNNPNPVATGAAAVGSYGNANFDRFCSGSSYSPESFGSGRGFLDHMYITGEEVAGGNFVAVDSATRTLWEMPDLGVGSWENAALVDTGTTTHVALILSSDVGSGSGDTMRLYVGQKGIDANTDGQVDFLERNGLRGGTVYHFLPDAGFSTTSFPDTGGQVTGAWNISSRGALRETKLEDVHTNPLDGTQVVVGVETDGIYRIDLNMQFTGDVSDVGLSTAAITQIVDNSTPPIGAPDNLTWSPNGTLYVQEDGNGNDVWQMDADGANIAQIAHALSEPSGIFDMSSLVGYQSGSLLLTSVQGSGGSGAQLSVLIAPDAALVPEPTTLALGFWAAVVFLITYMRRREGLRTP